MLISLGIRIPSWAFRTEKEIQSKLRGLIVSIKLKRAKFLINSLKQGKELTYQIRSVKVN